MMLFCLILSQRMQAAGCGWGRRQRPTRNAHIISRQVNDAGWTLCSEPVPQRSPGKTARRTSIVSTAELGSPGPQEQLSPIPDRCASHPERERSHARGRARRRGPTGEGPVWSPLDVSPPAARWLKREVLEIRLSPLRPPLEVRPHLDHRGIGRAHSERSTMRVAQEPDTLWIESHHVAAHDVYGDGVEAADQNPAFLRGGVQRTLPMASQDPVDYTQVCALRRVVQPSLLVGITDDHVEVECGPPDRGVAPPVTFPDVRLRSRRRSRSRPPPHGVAIIELHDRQHVLEAEKSVGVADELVCQHLVYLTRGRRFVRTDVAALRWSPYSMVREPPLLIRRANHVLEAKRHAAFSVVLELRHTDQAIRPQDRVRHAVEIHRLRVRLGHRILVYGRRAAKTLVVSGHAREQAPWSEVDHGVTERIAHELLFGNHHPTRIARYLQVAEVEQANIGPDLVAKELTDAGQPIEFRDLRDIHLLYGRVADRDPAAALVGLQNVVDKPPDQRAVGHAREQAPLAI